MKALWGLGHPPSPLRHARSKTRGGPPQKMRTESPPGASPVHFAHIEVSPGPARKISNLQNRLPVHIAPADLLTSTPRKDHKARAPHARGEKIKNPNPQRGTL
jgi:hypothetical protein